MAKQPTIRWRSGRGTVNFKADDNRFTKAIEESVKTTLLKGAGDDSTENMTNIKKSVEKAASKELKRMVPFMTRNLIGKPSTTGHPLTISADLLSIDRSDGLALAGSLRTVKSGRVRDIGRAGGKSITWARLSQNTIKKKKLNKEKFFLHKGSLLNYFKKNSQRLVSKIGETRVNIKKSRTSINDLGQKVHIVGEVIIKIAPNATASTLPALRTGNWTSFDDQINFEKKMGFPDWLLKRLYGPTKRKHQIVHRPLLQPVVSFWLLHRIPAVIVNAIVKSKVQKGSVGRVRRFE